MKKLIILIAMLSIGCVGMGGYDTGQFVPQTGLIKLNHPEPDTNKFLCKKKEDMLHPERWNTSDLVWTKRCEWWLKTELDGR
jgi:hypothetical protein